MTSCQNTEFPLFWRAEYSNLHAEKIKILEFEIQGSVLKIPYANMNNKFSSPGVGTFGGFYSLSDEIDWEMVSNEFMKKTPHHIQITYPPNYFAKSKFDEQRRIFTSIRDCEIIEDTNQHVEVGLPIENLLSRGNQKKYRQFRENKGYVSLNRVEDLDEIITILQESRRRHGVQLSMSRESIHQAISELPDIYDTYVAKIGEEAIAAAITVRLTSAVKYVLYWGDRDGVWRSLSPTVALYNAIYENSKKENFSIIDLGVSSVEGVENPGLVRFKENLGARKTKRIKATFENLLN